MASDDATWKLVHAERARLADLFEGFTNEQWTAMSLCRGWSVKLCAVHIMSSGEQTPSKFIGGAVANGFRFNVMNDKSAHRLGSLDTSEIVSRLRARTTTTNKPPAPVVAMLGEVIVHGSDIRFPLGIDDDTSDEAKIACLNNFVASNFPIPARKYVNGLSLRTSDIAWQHGSGPEVTGPAQSLLLAVTGRSAGLRNLSGDGVAILRSRLDKSAVS